MSATCRFCDCPLRLVDDWWRDEAGGAVCERTGWRAELRAPTYFEVPLPELDGLTMVKVGPSVTPVHNVFVVHTPEPEFALHSPVFAP